MAATVRWWIAATAVTASSSFATVITVPVKSPIPKSARPPATSFSTSPVPLPG